METDITSSRAASPQLLLAPRDAAKVLSLSERTLFTLRKNGALQTVLVGRAVRFPIVELERWIAEQTGKAVQK